MREMQWDLWTTPADARAITTNGTIKREEDAVMGRGCAEVATRRFPGIAYQLGKRLQRYGNHVHVFEFPRVVEFSRFGTGPIRYYDKVVTFPVKYHWQERADLALIRQSAVEFVGVLNANPCWETVLLPRPGCGNGGLRWEDVRAILAPILDDRVVVVWQ